MGNRPSARVRDLIIAKHGELGRAERRVGRILIDGYPLLWLEKVARIAEIAGVSPPTVSRFAAKLGFASFSAMQAAVKSEMHESMKSPLTLMDATDPNSAATGRGGRQDLLSALAGSAGGALDRITPDKLDQIVDLLTDKRRRIFCLGGRSSRILAETMVFHLNLMRPKVWSMNESMPPLADRAVDLRSSDVCILFDVRRYQPDVIAFARAAAKRGATVILMTDLWVSPIADDAEIVLPVDIEVPSPLDSLLPALALVEIILTECLDKLESSARARMRTLENTRSAFRETTTNRHPDSGETANG